MNQVSTSEENLFRVVLLNEFNQIDNADDIQKKVAARFRLSDKAVDHVFAGRPVVIKTNVDAETAFRFKTTLDQIGALSQVESMPEFDDTDASGYIERRIKQQRAAYDRRAQTRNGQILPDRRVYERRIN